MNDAPATPDPTREELRQRFLAHAAAAFDLMFASPYQDQLVTFDQRKSAPANSDATSPLGSSSATPTPTPPPGPTILRPPAVPSAASRASGSARPASHLPDACSPP